MESRGQYKSETHIRDPVYDEIGLSELELQILDSSEVQRLRQIKQLGAATRVYPSATHTRFSHSLGVMHISGLIGNSIGLDPVEITEARLAGLLHDTGHGPFSHTSEEVTGEEVFNHEERSADIAERICADLPVDESNIRDYILGNKKPSIVAGIIDSDRLDYVIRDSMFTSVNHGRVDVRSIVRFSCLNDGEITFEKKAIPSMNDLLSARLRMRKVVYRYPTVRHFSTLIKRAMEEYATENSIKDLIEHDDYTMHSRLKNTKNEYYNQVTQRKVIRDRINIGTEYLDRTELSNLSSKSDKKIREEICESLGISESKILVSAPYIPQNIPDRVRIINDGKVGNLSDFSKYPRYLNEESWNETSICIYIDQNYNTSKETIKEIVKESARS
jgi:HD superfamily phosphohydrolase